MKGRNDNSQTENLNFIDEFMVDKKANFISITLLLKRRKRLKL